MPRPLTDLETAVLAHAVPDPVAWWTNVHGAPAITDEEAALREKIARWIGPYQAAKAALGVNYKTRAQRGADG